MEYIYNNWSDISLQQINDNDWRNELLQNTKYNRRLKNMKLARLAKIGNLREIFIDLKSYEIAYYDMNIYYQNLNNKL